MKVPDSGMPEETYWESLLDVPLILDRLQIDSLVGDVVEIGCGYGTFTVPVARRIRGTVNAFDLDPEMAARTNARVITQGANNVTVHLRDVIADGFGLPPESCDAILLFNILHFAQAERLVQSAAKLLRPGGRVLAIHWRSDVPTPRGPSLSVRPRPADAQKWADAGELVLTETMELPPWHFGVVLTK